MKDIFTELYNAYKNGDAAYYNELRIKMNNVAKTAVELTEAQKKAIENKLLATTKYVEFEMHFDIDATLIGGMKIRIGDRVVDSSIKNKLNDLTRELSRITI